MAEYIRAKNLSVLSKLENRQYIFENKLTILLNFKLKSFV